MSLVLFYGLAGFSIACSILMVLSKSPVRSVLLLILTFIAIAGLYVLINAQFLAVVHIIVYAGAIMVLFLFVLMLLNLSSQLEPKTTRIFRITGGIAALLLVAILISATLDAHFNYPETSAADMGLVKNLGQLLFTKYLVPFEISSILFLAGMVGGVLLGKRDSDEPDAIRKDNL